MKKSWIYGIILLALFIACCLPHMNFTPGSPSDPDPNQTPITAVDTLIAHFIDVGQADSALLQLPNGQTMLIDAGGEVRDYIHGLGIQKIDYLVATHPHSDHIGYIEDVVREFEIGEIYMPRVSHTSKTFENMLLAIQEKGLKIKTAKAGVTALDTEDLDIVFVAPAQEHYEDLNNYSAIVKITYKSKSILFTGDAEALSESQITADIDADVLKVGHHGSSTSTSKRFLDRVSPQIAVISCGADNEYSHPHREVLQRLSSRNIEIYRTDESGTIIVYCDGENLNVECEY